MKDPTLWTDENDMSYPSPAWKSLDLPDAEGMFHARVVRSGTNSVQVLSYPVSIDEVASNCGVSNCDRGEVWQ